MTVKPQSYIIGILIFTLVIVGGVSILGSFKINDGQTAEFNKTFNKMNDVTGAVDDLQGGIENADTDFGVFGVLNSLISSAWQSLKLLFTSLGFMTTAFGGMTTMFGVPAWIPLIFASIITVIIIFAIYSAIFQRDL